MATYVPVSQRYFDAVITVMKDLGLMLLSQVAIDTNDFTFHVFTSYARSTRLFFYKNGLNCFVILSFTETKHSDGSKRYHWNIRTDVEFQKPQRRPSKLLKGEEAELDITSWEPKCTGFRHTGWCGGQNVNFTWNLDQVINTTQHPLASSKLAESVSSLLQSIGDDLALTPFEELSVSSWEPDYCFKGCGELFWERFRKSSNDLSGDSRLLWKLVTRPWGSSGLKR